MKAAASNGLETLGVPPATVRIASWFARHPTARPTVRELQRTLGVSSASAQRDLDRLVRGGALRVVSDGRLRRYAPRMDAPLWQAVRILSGLDVPAPPPDRVRERATRYGVDIGQLESMLRLTIAERLTLLDSNAAFIAAAQSAARPAGRKART
jgi:MarR family protein